MKYHQEWKGAQGPAPPKKKVTKVTRIAYMGLKVYRLKKNEVKVTHPAFLVKNPSVKLTHSCLISAI